MHTHGGFEAYFEELSQLLHTADDDASLFQAIVDGPFRNKLMYVPMGLALMVLVLVNTTNKTLDRIALSDTESAHGAVDFSVKPFKDINVPLTAKDNMYVSVAETGKWQHTDDWKDTFTPILTPEEARFNQAGAAVSSTVVYPLMSRDKGALSFSYFKPLRDIDEVQHEFMRTYTSMVDEALARIQAK